MKNLYNLYLLVSLCIYTGCTPANEIDVPEKLDNPRAIIVSEGQFGYGSASLTSLTYGGEIEQDLFRRINKRPLGDVAQSITRIGDNFYVALNNSRKLEVMDANTFTSVETMPIGLDVIPMYVQHLGGDSIIVSDQRTNSQLIIMDINHGKDRPIVRRTVSMGGGNRSFQMQLIDGKLFVGADKLSVFDLGKITADARREVKKQNGNHIQTVDFSKLVIDKNGLLWTLDNGQLIAIDPKTEKTVYELDLSKFGINNRTSCLDISPDGSTLYFNSSQRIYTVNADNPQIPTQVIELPSYNDGRTVYLMTISKENTIFLSEVLYGSLSRSRIYEYDLNGKELQNFRAGIFSHYIYFY